MVKIKGTSLAGRRRYLERYHGEEKLRAVLAQLRDREGAKRIEIGVLKSQWYPFELFLDLIETSDRVVGEGDGKLYRSMAARTAEDDLSTVYKVFFRFMQPMYGIGKAAELWSAYYSSGKLKMTPLDPSKIELEIIDFESPHWAHCESVLGWAQRSIELTGVKDVACDHVDCRSRGGSRCRMHLSWKE
jgi:hypothetical protein